MKSTAKGDRGVAKVISIALSHGYKVYMPFSYDDTTDLIVERNSRLEKIQIKATTPIDGKLTIKCASTSSWGSKTRSVKKYTKADIDWLVCYDLVNDQCVFIDAVLLGSGKRTIKIKVENIGQYQNW